MARRSASFFCRLCCSSSIRRAAVGTKGPLSSPPSSGPSRPTQPLRPTHCRCQQAVPTPRCILASSAAPDPLHAASACAQRMGSSRLTAGPPSLSPTDGHSLPRRPPCTCLAAETWVPTPQDKRCTSVPSSPKPSEPQPSMPLNRWPLHQPPVHPLLSIPQRTRWPSHRHPVPASSTFNLSAFLHPAARYPSSRQISSN